MKKTPVVQYVDHEAAAEFFDLPNGMLTKDVKRFEADLRHAQDQRTPVYVAVVETTRHCGGPEEGGWYYDWDQVVETRECHSFKHLLQTVRELRWKHPTCRRGRHSVVGGADVTIYMMRDERLIDRLQSKEIPKYE